MNNSIIFNVVTKSNIIDFVDTLLEPVREGNKTACEAVAYAKVLEEIAKKLRKEIEAQAINEINNRGATYINGAKVEAVERNSYNFTKSNCPEYADLLELYAEKMQELDAISEKIKAREAYLKSIKEPKEFINPKTGELCILMPVYPTVQAYIKVTISK